MAMRYGTDDVEAGRRRRRAGQVPARQVEGTYRVDPRGNVTPPKELAPQQPRATGRQTVNEETPRRGLAPEFLRFMAQNPMPQVGQIGGRVPPTRPQLSQAVDRFIDKYGGMQRDARMQRPQGTPMPFAQQLVQSGMMNTQPIWDTSSGQGVNAPGYSVNPMHPMWGNPTPPRFPNPGQYGNNIGMNPMNYYWDNPNMQGVPRVWTGSEITPQGFRGIMNQYGNIPWMRQMQMNPFGF